MIVWPLLAWALLEVVLSFAAVNENHVRVPTLFRKS